MKKIRLTIFQKIVLFIILILLPIIVLYTYSHMVSVSVVKKEIQDSIQRRLSFLQNQMDLQLNYIVRNTFQLSSDPMLNSYQNLEGFENYFDVVTFKKQLLEKINIQSTTMDWSMQISVYFPRDREVVSNIHSVVYNDEYLEKHVGNSWDVRKEEAGGQKHFDFYFYATYPFYYNSQPGKAEHIVEVKFSDANIMNMLDGYKLTGNGDPFLYHQEYGIITNRSAGQDLLEQVALQLRSRELKSSDSFQTVLNDSSYLVYYIKSASLDWLLVDFIPVQQVLLPINESRNLFYISTSLLLLMGIVGSFLLYRNVQIPIGRLMKGLQKIKQGNYSVRIEKYKSTEFDYVYQRFNEMAEQTQQLIENVYMEQLAARDARLKQMQSQINPHFLYNSLYYIVNMTRLGREEAVEKMAVNLGEYFKYTTRLENQDATLTEEIQLLTNYLEIQNLRMNRIRYSIDIPQDILLLEVPRLLLQPVVENAVIHGIEPRVGEGHIFITGKREGLRIEIVVEDDGVGVTNEKLNELARQLKMPMDSSMGYGIWNVNQRLGLRFGEEAGVRFSHSAYGGLAISIVWNMPETGEYLEKRA